MQCPTPGVAGLSITLLAIAAVGAGAAEGAVIHVPSQQPTIQAAINAAKDRDFVIVADGVYSGVGNYNIDFLGKAITLLSANGPEHCIIDAQGRPQDQRMAFYFHSNETSASVLTGFTITGGYAFNGAGIFLSQSSPTISNCIITGNHADCWGAGLYYQGESSPKITDCAFLQNYSGDDGGAIFGFGGNATVSNTWMIGNISEFTGGAVTSFGSGMLTISNCTIAQNSGTWGAAVFGWGITITNTVIWDNTGDEQIRVGTSGADIIVRYSAVQDGFNGTGNISANPQFADPSNGDFHLLHGSPAIDAGDPLALVDAGMSDVDGDPRKFGTRIDMGIDEFRKLGDATGDHQVNVNDMLAVINKWGPCVIDTADLNSDFVINVNDLLLVINHWGS